MAKGTWKMVYGFTVNKVSDDSVLVTVNATQADTTSRRFHSLSGVTAACSAFIRRFQSAGIDVYGLVVGAPKGADADDPVLAMDGAYTGLQTYARIDTPDYALRWRIGKANADKAAGTEETPPASDLPEDALAA